VLLHKGFADAYDSVKGVIRTVLDDLCRRPTQRGGQAMSLYVSGHSLGGALATLCAWDLATRKCAVSGLSVGVTFMVASDHPAQTRHSGSCIKWSRVADPDCQEIMRYP
jgi:alpha-beta hydrolase superfamily lysophospholipase